MLDRSVAHREVRRLAAWSLRRLQPVAGPRLWSAAVAARSAAGRGPLVVAPLAGRALVLAPHPDDETIGCGGTVAKLAERGAEVHVLVATSGGASVAQGGGRATTEADRRSETEAACRQLGARPPTFLDLPDAALGDHLDELTAGVDRAVRDLRPDVVFAPWPGDDHPDHQAVATALAAADVPPATEVWCYEVWSALPANRLVDVTETWSRRSAALACHRSAGDLSAHEGLSRWRSLFGLDGQGHAEAFIVGPANDLLDNSMGVRTP